MAQGAVAPTLDSKPHQHQAGTGFLQTFQALPSYPAILPTPPTPTSPSHFAYTSHAPHTSKLLGHCPPYLPKKSPSGLGPGHLGSPPFTEVLQSFFSTLQSQYPKGHRRETEAQNLCPKPLPISRLAQGLPFKLGDAPVDLHLQIQANCPLRLDPRVMVPGQALHKWGLHSHRVCSTLTEQHITYLPRVSPSQGHSIHVEGRGPKGRAHAVQAQNLGSSSAGGCLPKKLSHDTGRG